MLTQKKRYCPTYWVKTASSVAYRSLANVAMVMKYLNLIYISIPAASRVGLFCTVLSSIFYFYISNHPLTFFHSIDSRLTDIMFAVRGPRQSSGMVVIVDIDDNSLKRFGPWPWPKNLMAELIDKIVAAETSAVGFDLMFSKNARYSQTIFNTLIEPLTAELPVQYRESFKSALLAQIDSEQQLAQTLQHQRAIQGYRFLFQEDFHKIAGQKPNIKNHQATTYPDTQFRDVQLISAYRAIYNSQEIRNSEGSEGFINLIHNQLGQVRKAPLFLLMDNSPYPSLDMAMILAGREQPAPVLHLERKRIGKYFPVKGVSFLDDFYPTDTSGQISINFRGPSNTFLYLSAGDILDGSATPFLKDKYVLIGSTASGNIDLVATPYSSRIPGVEVHANILDNLIQNDPLVEESELEHLLSFMLIAFGGAFLSIVVVFLPPLLGFCISGLFLTSLVLANYYVLFLHNRTTSISAILFLLFFIFLIVTLSSYFFEGKKRVFIRRAFSQYVSPEVVNELVRHPEKLDLLIDSREVTVLFCDIRNFTHLAESLSPTDISLFLNSYFSLLTEIIMKHNGMVDKYIGDAIMAVWGTPLKDTDHAVHGVQAALEMVEVLKENSDTLLLSGQPVQIGIGINSGMVSAGNFGCSRRFDYTVLGDTVNLASRVENTTRSYPTTILITEHTRERITQSIPTRLIDTVQVKGRTGTVEIYEPLTGSVKSHESANESLLHAQAMSLYKKGDFKAALGLFERLYSLTSDPLYNFNHERCRLLLEKPPTSKWTGVSRFQ